MSPSEPFAHQTFRCPYCGSGTGPACTCRQVAQERTRIKPLDLPKIKIPDLKPLDLDRPRFLKKPWGL